MKPETVLTMMWALALLLFSNSVSADECAGIKDKTVSVTVGFEYTKTPLELPNAQGDTKYYHQIGSSLAKNARVLDDRDTNHTTTKTQFLTQLRNAIGDKEYVNFNYVGHGFRMPDGEWAMALPGIYDGMVKCGEGIQHTKTKRGYVIDLKASEKLASCPAFRDRVVTASDLRQVFNGKKVFGFADACNTGALDLGKDSQMVNATQGNEEDMDEHSLSSFLKTKSSHDCSLHTDDTGAASYSEILRMFPLQSGSADRFSNLQFRAQHQMIHDITYIKEDYAQTPTRTGAPSTSWSPCMKVKLPENKCGNGSQQAPDAASSTQTDISQ